jgi:hypothetical protein
MKHKRKKEEKYILIVTLGQLSPVQTKVRKTEILIPNHKEYKDLCNTSIQP